MRITSIKEKYNTEIALIILCCRYYLQTSDRAAVQKFLQENVIDWNKIYQLVTAHRIRPVVYNVLSSFSDVIAENLIELRNYCIYFNAFALSNKRELHRILILLKDNNISAKPYKGLDFTQNFYGNMGLREFSDIDIIINEFDIDKVISIITKEGYHSKGLAFYKKFPKQFVRDFKDITFEKWTGKSRDFAIEFHFKPVWSFQGYPFTFNEILGKDHLNQLTYNANQYLALITLSNGLMDYYPNIRSLLDLALIFKKAEHSIINNFDPILSEYLHCGKQISFNVLEYPNIQPQVSGTYNGNNFCHYLQNNLLIMNAGKRRTDLQYMYINLKYIGPMKYKLWQFKNFIFYIIRPRWVDIEYIDLPYYFLYYFTRPFRILIRGK